MKKMSLRTDFSEELDNYRRRCSELEEKSKKDEIRCLALEVEVRELRKKKEELEGKITAIQKIVGNGGKGKGMVVDLTEENDEDKLLQLMIENKVLQCEKTKAETELCYSKKKVKELELCVFELEAKMTIKCKDKSHLENDDVSIMVTPETIMGRNDCLIDEEKVKEGIDVISTKLAPSTPGVARPNVFGVSDENVNYSKIPKVKKLSDSSDCSDGQCSPKNNIERTNVKHFDEEDMDEFKGLCSDTISGKRKRASKIVTSDDDTRDDDDNALICTLKTRNSSQLRIDSDAEVNDVNWRHPRRLRKLESINKQDENTFDLNKTVCLHKISSSEGEEDDGVEEGSESEDDSMGGFIVKSSESDSDLGSGNDNSCDEAEDAASDFKATLDKLRRKKASNLKWDLEGDMLADFGKDPELCMKAVCALYRQQTKDEKASKETIHQNERGFSHTDAFRGSKLGEYLTDGDSSGNLSKTVEELRRYDTKGVETCMGLAAKYSKQLFAIYKNKEDPYFLP